MAYVKKSAGISENLSCGLKSYYLQKSICTKKRDVGKNCESVTKQFRHLKKQNNTNLIKLDNFGCESNLLHCI